MEKRDRIYFGSSTPFISGDPEIEQNRKRFLIEYDIENYPKHIPLYITKETQDYDQGGVIFPFDHTYEYKDQRKNWVITTSPYGDTEKLDKLLLPRGFERYYPLYCKQATTYIKTIRSKFNQRR